MNIETLVLLYFIGFFIVVGEVAKIGMYFFMAMIIAISIGISIDNTTFRLMLGMIALFSAYRFGRSANFWGGER